MDRLLDVLMFVMAAGAIVDLIKNGSIFERLRTYLALRGGYWHDLTSCAYCFNHATALAIALVFYLPCLFGVPALATLARAVIFGFCVGRLAWLFNRALPADLRYERNDASA